MAENHEMNYYNYGKTLSAEGVMPIINENITPDPEPEHEYVDLGLPSGTLWATCNIGATTPDEPGLFFAWGETQGYTEAQVGHEKNFSWGDEELPNDYEFGPFNHEDETNVGMTKYNNTDELTTLEPDDDAATVNWGSNWKMPTKEQFEELIDNTTNAWDSERSGWTFTSSNGNSLFLFAAGSAGNGVVNEVGEFGLYWSSSSPGSGNVVNAWYMDFGGEECNVDNYGRCYGCSVRPVRG